MDSKSMTRKDFITLTFTLIGSGVAIAACGSDNTNGGTGTAGTSGSAGTYGGRGGTTGSAGTTGSGGHGRHHRQRGHHRQRAAPPAPAAPAPPRAPIHSRNAARRQHRPLAHRHRAGLHAQRDHTADLQHLGHARPHAHGDSVGRPARRPQGRWLGDRDLERPPGRRPLPHVHGQLSLIVEPRRGSTPPATGSNGTAVSAHALCGTLGFDSARLRVQAVRLRCQIA